MRRRTAAARLAVGLFVFLVAARSPADDKDLLVRASAPSNLMIVFGNSQTTQQPILGASSAWDGDADSPASKMGAAKRVVAQFTRDKADQFNFGLTTFSHNPNAGSISSRMVRSGITPRVAPSFTRRTWPTSSPRPNP